MRLIGATLLGRCDRGGGGGLRVLRRTAPPIRRRSPRAPAITIVYPDTAERFRRRILRSCSAVSARVAAMVALRERIPCARVRDRQLARVDPAAERLTGPFSDRGAPPAPGPSSRRPPSSRASPDVPARRAPSLGSTRRASRDRLARLSAGEGIRLSVRATPGAQVRLRMEGKRTQVCSCPTRCRRADMGESRVRHPIPPRTTPPLPR